MLIIALIVINPQLFNFYSNQHRILRESLRSKGFILMRHIFSSGLAKHHKAFYFVAMT